MVRCVLPSRVIPSTDRLYLPSLQHGNTAPHAARTRRKREMHIMETLQHPAGEHDAEWGGQRPEQARTSEAQVAAVGDGRWWGRAGTPSKPASATRGKREGEHDCDGEGEGSHRPRRAGGDGR
ncbi:hypothetical protein K438DRAFT_1804463 [Mycena galopus ATCC 62051]|nr:hypothetical protein K438DRAFT_1804463 [Mycena galopus ATCC 62051]